MQEPSRPSAARVRSKVFRYRTTMQARPDQVAALHSDGKPALEITSPPEFKGREGYWTPEDLLVAAVESCTMMTFFSIARKLDVPVTRYESSAEGVLELVDGAWRFTQVIVRPVITIASPDALLRANQALEKVHSQCLVSNSLRSDVTVQPSVLVEQEGLAPLAAASA